MSAQLLAKGFGASDLFQLLRDGAPQTRAQLASATGLSRSTIALRLDELIELELVAPIRDAVSTGGRPSALMALNPAARVVLAAEFGASHATVALVDLSAAVIAEHTEEVEVALGPEQVLGWFIDVANRLLDEAGRPPSDIVAIGIGLPGPVEHETGRPKNPPIMPGWDDFDVPRFVRAAFDVLVLVDNDVNLRALGERATMASGTENMILVKVSTGIGAGIVSDGHLIRGAQGIAGDLGHVQVSGRQDVVCTCGNRGCLEAVAGGPAIAANLRKAGLATNSVRDVVEAARSGNVLATQALRQAGRDIGEVLTTCVSLINPSVILIGGSLARAGDHLIAGVREVAYARSMPLATSHLTIASSRPDDTAGVIGAAVMAIESALSPAGIETMARRIAA